MRRFVLRNPENKWYTLNYYTYYILVMTEIQRYVTIYLRYVNTLLRNVISKTRNVALRGDRIDVTYYVLSVKLLKYT